MFFNSLNKKLKKSYSVVNPEIGKLIFPNGEAEYIYVGTMLDTLFSKRDVFELIKIYASVYSYYKDLSKKNKKRGCNTSRITITLLIWKKKKILIEAQTRFQFGIFGFKSIFSVSKSRFGEIIPD